MNRVLLALLFLLVGLLPWLAANAGMSIAPGTPTHTHSDANTGGGVLSLSGGLTSTKACITGFTRATPNYCRVNALTTLVTVANTTCTQTSSLTGLTDAKAVVVQFNSNIFSANSVALRTVTLQSFAPTDTSCAGSALSSVTSQFREFSATATTLIGSSSGFDIIPSNSTGQIVLKASTVCATCSIGVNIIGYMD